VQNVFRKYGDDSWGWLLFNWVWISFV
jgi:hypothetical protein